MRARPLIFPALLALALLQEAVPALAASQAVALFTPEIVDGSASGAGAGVSSPDRDALASRLEQAIKDKLQDRFDIRLAGAGAAGEDGDARARRARVVGATYTLTAVVTRIGRSVALDLTLAPVEEPGKGKTVAVTGTDTEASSSQAKELPFLYRRLVLEGCAKLKLAFFGDEAVGEGARRHRIPRLAAAVGRSGGIAGDVISVALMDTDRNGKDEVVAAYPDSVAIYAVERDDLAEKARIPYPGGGIVRVDAADANRNGIAEIVVVRYLSGKAVSDIWEFDGKEYRRVASDLPYFLRILDLGAEGMVLAGQESDPVNVFRGPVLRVVADRSRAAGKERGTPLPLPPGTWIYAFTPLQYGGKTRFAILDEGGRLSLLNEKGEHLGETTESVSGTDLVLDAPLGSGESPKRLAIPNRLFAVDLDGDKNDEIVVLNNLVVPGGFFEKIKVYANSEALCFAQDGDRLELAWRTSQIDGAARDSFVASRKAGGPLRMGVATRDRGKILGRFGEWRVLWLK